MSDRSIPPESELYLPVLQATSNLGGEARHGEIDEAALALAGLNPDASLSDPDGGRTPLANRLGWARSNLKRAGALDSLGGGTWAITEFGRDCLGMESEDAVTALVAARNEGYAGSTPNDDLVEEWISAAQKGKPEKLSARDLIKLWNINRRWSSANQRIREFLASRGLATVPDFTLGSLDDEVQLVLVAPGARRQPQVDDDELSKLTVGNLPSAKRGVTGVTPSDDLLKAHSIMEAFDYSQLSVMSGPRRLDGAISWESIARARLHNPQAGLRECMTEPVVVDQNTPLLQAVPDIVEAGFVFVAARDKVITGLVTTADLSAQFVALTEPFLLVGEIEGLLRLATDAAFSPEELQELIDPDDPDREIEGAHSTTLGELQRVIEAPGSWERFEWTADRKTFLEVLDRVRRVRNEITHFSPDPLSAEDLQVLQSFLNWLRTLMNWKARTQRA